MNGRGRVTLILAVGAIAVLAVWMFLVPPMKSTISTRPNVPGNTDETSRATPPAEPPKTEAPGKK